MTGAILVGSYLSIWAFMYAVLEVQTEGPVGWALGAPTWRKKSATYSAIMNGKELTGYHLVMFFLPLYLLVGTFVFDRYWSGEWRLASSRHSVELLSWYLMMSVNWDFMWFPLNPYFGLKRFRKGEIHWHAKWIGPVPVDYVGGLVGAAVFTAVVGALLGADGGIWLRQAVILGVILSGTFLAVLFAPAIQRWQTEMRVRHGSLTEDWKIWLTPSEYDNLLALLRFAEQTREKIAAMGRIRARREQLGEPRPEETALRKS